MSDSTEDEELSETMPRMPGSVPHRRAKKKGFLSKAGEPGGETDLKGTCGCGGCGGHLGSVYSLRVELRAAALNTASTVAANVSLMELSWLESSPGFLGPCIPNRPEKVHKVLLTPLLTRNCFVLQGSITELSDRQVHSSPKVFKI